MAAGWGPACLSIPRGERRRRDRSTEGVAAARKISTRGRELVRPRWRSRGAWTMGRPRRGPTTTMGPATPAAAAVRTRTAATPARSEKAQLFIYIHAYCSPLTVMIAILFLTALTYFFSCKKLTGRFYKRMCCLKVTHALELLVLASLLHSCFQISNLILTYLYWADCYHFFFSSALCDIKISCLL